MIACIVNDIHEIEITVTGEDFQHLYNSLRVKVGSLVLVLNGKGEVRKTEVLSIGKKNLVLSGGSASRLERESNIDVLLSVPKREALNDCIRMSCELGVRNIYLFESEYTQNKKVDIERLKKVLKSAVIQSNNPFTPNIEWHKSIDSISDIYEAAFLFHLADSNSVKAPKISKDKRQLIIIGPEGGFSESDLLNIRKKFSHVETRKLSGSILRAPTALCAALSWANSNI